MGSVDLQKKITDVTAIICRQGVFRLPVNETSNEIVRRLVGDNEEELDLIAAFRDIPSQTLSQLVQSSGMDENKVVELAERLARKGLIFNQSNSSGQMVYRLLPLVMIGVMEYRFMTPVTGSAEEKELALLFEKLLEQYRDQVQENYEELIPIFKKSPPVDRTVPIKTNDTGKPIRIIPVKEQLDCSEEYILPSQTVEEIIEKYDDIAVGQCFCRQRRGILGDPCAINAPTRNCFSFGKSARHTIAQGFAEKISKTEAIQILREAEQAGLIHKTFHPASKESKPETSICNCCKCCCDTFKMWREGSMPLVNSTYHLAMIDPDLCIGCGTCEERCPTDAIHINEDGVAERAEEACLGCGVCARFCPEEAISLQESLRRVFIMPPRVSK